MKKTDRIARDRWRARQADAKAAGRAHHAAEVARREALESEARSLATRAVHALETSGTAEPRLFKISARSGGSMFSRSRGGWYIGSVDGAVGHGERGDIAVFLLSTGQFVFGGGSSSPGSAAVANEVAFFNDRQLTAVVDLLRTVVAGPTDGP